jgi:hypothetical protein
MKICSESFIKRLRGLDIGRKLIDEGVVIWLIVLFSYDVSGNTL